MKYFVECHRKPTKAGMFVLNQGLFWRTFTQYGDAEAFAEQLNLDDNPVTIIEIKVALEMKGTKT